MIKIVLYPLEQPAIIVKAKTGLVYTNQTAGVMCHHPEQEGFLVLLDPPPRKFTIFDSNRWYDEMPAFNNETYDEIEATLNRKHAYYWHIRDIRVDRTAKNEEAWIHVRFRGDFSKEGNFRTDWDSDPQPQAFPEYEGILTWKNCD